MLGRAYVGSSIYAVPKYEVQAVCRHCKRSTVFVLRLTDLDILEQIKAHDYWQSLGHLNDSFEISTFVSIKDQVKLQPPEFVPEEIAQIFVEASTCASVNCWNAALAMYRLCLDLTTKHLLATPPAEGDGPNNQQKNFLKPRISYLIDSGQLPPDLEALLENLKDDGNDGAHDGGLTEAEAHDAGDFAFEMLKRVYTDPKRLELAAERREQRRSALSGGPKL